MKSRGRVAEESTSSPLPTARPGGISRATMRPSGSTSMGTSSRRRPCSSSNSLSLSSRLSQTWTSGGASSRPGSYALSVAR